MTFWHGRTDKKALFSEKAHKSQLLTPFFCFLNFFQYLEFV